MLSRLGPVTLASNDRMDGLIAMVDDISDPS